MFFIIQSYIVFESKMLGFIKEKEKNIEEIELYSNYLFSNLKDAIETAQATVVSEILEATTNKVLKLFHMKTKNREVKVIVLEDLDSL